MAVVLTGVPDIILKQTIIAGVEAISANVALLDAIWAGLTAADLAKLKAFWAEHPPTVLTGFARRSDPFPCFAITLASDANERMLLDDGEFFDEDEDEEIGRESTTTTFRIYVYAENPDVCAAYYRVLRRIIQVGRRRLEARGFNSITLGGAELAPDPSYTPDNLFVRQVTLNALLEEVWPMDPATDALAAALVTDQPARLSALGELNIAHEDSGGAVHPVTDTE